MADKNPETGKQKVYANKAYAPEDVDVDFDFDLDFDKDHVSALEPLNINHETNKAPQGKGLLGLFDYGKDQDQGKKSQNTTKSTSKETGGVIFEQIKTKNINYTDLGDVIELDSEEKKLVQEDKQSSDVSIFKDINEEETDEHVTDTTKNNETKREDEKEKTVDAEHEDKEAQKKLEEPFNELKEQFGLVDGGGSDGNNASGSGDNEPEKLQTETEQEQQFSAIGDKKAGDSVLQKAAPKQGDAVEGQDSSMANLFTSNVQDQVANDTGLQADLAANAAQQQIVAEAEQLGGVTGREHGLAYADPNNPNAANLGPNETLDSQLAKKGYAVDSPEYDSFRKGFLSGYNKGFAKGQAQKQEELQKAAEEKKAAMMANEHYKKGLEACIKATSTQTQDQDAGEALMNEYRGYKEAHNNYEIEKENNPNAKAPTGIPSKEEVNYFYLAYNESYFSNNEQAQNAKDDALENAEAFKKGHALGIEHANQKTRGELAEDFQPNFEQLAGSADDVEIFRKGYFRGFNDSYLTAQDNAFKEREQEKEDKFKNSPIYNEGVRIGQQDAKSAEAFMTGEKQASEDNPMPSWDTYREQNKPENTYQGEDLELFRTGYLRGYNEGSEFILFGEDKENEKLADWAYKMGSFYVWVENGTKSDNKEEKQRTFETLQKQFPDVDAAGQLNALKEKLKKIAKGLVPIGNSKDVTAAENAWENTFDENFNQGRADWQHVTGALFQKDAQATNGTAAGGGAASVETHPEYLKGYNEGFEVMKLYYKGLKEVETASADLQDKVRQKLDLAVQTTITQANQAQGKTPIPNTDQENGQSKTYFGLGFQVGINEATGALAGDQEQRTGDREARKALSEQQLREFDKEFGKSPEEVKAYAKQLAIDSKESGYDAAFEFCKQIIPPTQSIDLSKNNFVKEKTKDITSHKNAKISSALTDLKKLLERHWQDGQAKGITDGTSYRYGYMKGYAMFLGEAESKNQADIEKILSDIYKNDKNPHKKSLNTSSDFFIEGISAGQQDAEEKKDKGEMESLESLGWDKGSAYQKGYTSGMRNLKAAFFILNGIPFEQGMISGEDLKKLKEMMGNPSPNAAPDLNKLPFNEIMKAESANFRLSLMKEIWDNDELCAQYGINKKEMASVFSSKNKDAESKIKKTKEIETILDSNKTFENQLKLFENGFEEAQKKINTGNHAEEIQNKAADVSGYVLGFLSTIHDENQYPKNQPNGLSYGDREVILTTLKKRLNQNVQEHFQNLLSAESASLTQLHKLINQEQNKTGKYPIYFKAGLTQGQAAAKRTLQYSQNNNGEVTVSLQDDYTKAEDQEDDQKLENYIQKVSSYLDGLKNSQTTKEEQQTAKISIKDPSVIHALGFITAFLKDSNMKAVAIRHMENLRLNPSAFQQLQKIGFAQNRAKFDEGLQAGEEFKYENGKATQGTTQEDVFQNVFQEVGVADLLTNFTLKLQDIQQKLAPNQWAFNRLATVREESSYEDFKTTLTQFENKLLKIEDRQEKLPSEDDSSWFLQHRGDFSKNELNLDWQGKGFLAFAPKGLNINSSPQLLNLQLKQGDHDLSLTAKGGQLKASKASEGFQLLNVRFSFPVLERQLRIAGLPIPTKAISEVGLGKNGIVLNNKNFTLDTQHPTGDATAALIGGLMNIAQKKEAQQETDLEA